MYGTSQTQAQKHAWRVRRGRQKKVNVGDGIGHLCLTGVINLPYKSTY